MQPATAEEPGRDRPLQARAGADRRGDAAAPRRARAADRRRRRSAELVEPPGSSSRAAGQPDLDPLAGDDLADPGQRRFPPPRPAPRRRVEPLRRERRQQLVVLAAARPPARAGRARPRAATSATPVGQRQRARRRSAGRRRCAAARWPASPPSPSLRSIIAVAPAAASARPAASRGVGSSWRRAQPLARSRLGTAVGQLRALEQQQAGRGAAELAGERPARRRAARRRA